MRKGKIKRIVTALLCAGLLLQTTMVSSAEESISGNSVEETGNASAGGISKTADSTGAGGSGEASDTQETGETADDGTKESGGADGTDKTTDGIDGTDETADGTGTENGNEGLPGGGGAAGKEDGAQAEGGPK